MGFVAKSESNSQCVFFPLQNKVVHRVSKKKDNKKNKKKKNTGNLMVPDVSNVAY